jgi:hypothetical protein
MLQGSSDMRNPEWVAFTNNLWKLQFLQKRDLVLSEEVREVWYDLSQGVMDIVVKLFVLAQLRALALEKERITPGLLRQVYKDDLKPVHPMLAALRSGIPEKIAQYSDLMVPEMDKRLIQLQQKIAAIKGQTSEEAALQQLHSEDERRLYLMLKDDYDSSLLVATVRKAFVENPTLTRIELLPIIVNWLSASNINTLIEPRNTKNRSKVIKADSWDQLNQDDLRYIKSQHVKVKELHTALKVKGVLLELKSFLPLAS